jgi:DNA-binding FadR family transcriptional regulator
MRSGSPTGTWTSTSAICEAANDLLETIRAGDAERAGALMYAHVNAAIEHWEASEEIPPSTT